MSLRPLLRPLTRSGFGTGSSRAAARTFLPAASRQHFFHTTRPQFVQPGDPLPDTDVLQENSPGNRVNLAEEARKGAKKMLLIGVPAAFSPACSSKHVPGYVAHPVVKKKGEFDLVGVVSVNDVFVMKAWGETLDPGAKQGIRFLADPTGQFTKQLDLAFDGSAIFGGDRSKRYALIVEDGKVKSAYVEPDNTGTSVSLAENVLGPASA